MPNPWQSDGTPLQTSTSDRSLKQLLDLDWGVPKAERFVKHAADAAEQVYRVAVDTYGLNEEFASVAEQHRAAVTQ
ncbi:MAG: hypothetical protein FWD63_00290 [Propionibacteriaceae bacterium]|nr:hypothetical protein [Propionibacteriaceae bacterium]